MRNEDLNMLHFSLCLWSSLNKHYRLYLEIRNKILIIAVLHETCNLALGVCCSLFVCVLDDLITIASAL